MSHNPVTSLKNHGEWRGANSDWTPSPTLRLGEKTGFLLVLFSLKQNQEDFALSYQYFFFFLTAWGTLCNLPPVCFSVCELGMTTVSIVEKITWDNV